MPRLTDTKLGKQVVDLGKQIEQLDAAKGAAPAAKAGAAQQIGDGFDAKGAGEPVHAKARELQAKLDEVRGVIGPTAVQSLMAALPEAALAALEAVQPDLPIKPGESPFQAYRAGFAKLCRMETTVHQARDIIAGAVGPYAWSYRQSNSGAHLKDEGQIFRMLQAGTPPAQVAQAKNDSMWRYYTEQIAKDGGRKYNERLQAVWPDVPEQYLWKVPGGGGGTMTVQEAFAATDGYGRDAHKYEGPLKHDLATLRAQYPGYAELSKQLTALQAHVKKKACPSAEEIAVLKANALDPSTPVGELYQEASQLIAELDSFTTGSKIKREKLAHESKTESRNRTSGSSHEDRFAGAGIFKTKVGESHGSFSSSSHSTSHTQGTTEVLNVEAREYSFLITPELAKLHLDSLDGKNALDPLSTTVVMERMLTLRRIYEAMLVREPDSPHTQALKGWMEESKFHYSTIEKAWNGYSYSPKEQALGTVSMSSIRQDFVSLAQDGLYPADRTALLQEELSMGVAKPKSKLGVGSIGDL